MSQCELFQVQLPVDFGIGQKLKVTVPEGYPQVFSMLYRHSRIRLMELSGKKNYLFYQAGQETVFLVPPNSVPGQFVNVPLPVNKADILYLKLKGEKLAIKDR